VSYLIYNPATNRYPIRGFENPNRIKSPDAINIGFQYWRFSYNGNLSELQFDSGEGLRPFTVANGVSSFTAGENVSSQIPNFAALSDGVLDTTNDQRIGTAIGATYCDINAIFVNPVNIAVVGFYPQASGSAIYNIPGTIRVARSVNGINYDQIHEQQITTTGASISSTNFSVQGLTQDALNVFNLPS
jgi:hypothetical protein